MRKIEEFYSAFKNKLLFTDRVCETEEIVQNFKKSDYVFAARKHSIG